MKYNLTFILLIFLVLTSCAKREENEELILITEEPVIQPTNQVNTVAKKIRYWSSSDVNLPKGVVVKLDYAHGSETKEANFGDNYVTIELENGNRFIVRDIDIDTYLNLDEGDIIR